MNRLTLIPQRDELNPPARRVSPIMMDERVMVLRWESQEERKPEEIRPIQYPKETRKKREPASLCPIFNSSSIIGIKGEKTILERKFKEKIPTRKKMEPIWERKEVS